MTKNVYNIVWADDEIDLLKPHIMFLKAKGYEVETVSNGRDALDRAASRHYDLIILDENMPGISGLETLAEIKQTQPDVPVIVPVHQDHVAQDAFGCAIVALPQFHAHQRGRAHAHHGPESRRERHERPRKCQSHDGLRTHALTNEDAIDDVIHR